MLEIEIGLEEVSYRLREGECLVIRHETEEVRLTQEQPHVLRPIGQR
jgi:alpha,alpha-trehalose phosphorylase